MSIEADFYNTNAKYKSLDIEHKIGYSGNRLYAVVAESAFLAGADLDFYDIRRLCGLGLTSDNKRFSDYETAADLFMAYSLAVKKAKNGSFLTSSDINELHWILTRRNSVLTENDGACLKEKELCDFCERFNILCQNLPSLQLIDRYFITFDAFYEIVKLQPWKTANNRMARLVMNYIQKRYSLIPTRILTTDSQEYKKLTSYILDGGSQTDTRRKLTEFHVAALNKEISDFVADYSANTNPAQ